MYGCESWTTKKVECWRINASELWRWRRLLRVPWTARRSNQYILKEISLNVHWKDWCWSWSSNTLTTRYEGLTHWKRSDAGKDWRQNEKGMKRMRWLDGIIESMDMSLSKLLEFTQGQGSLACHSPWAHKELDRTKQLNWTELKQQFREVQVKCSCVVLTACRLKCLGEYMKYHKQQLWLSYLGTKVSSSLPHKNHNHNRS